MTKDKLDNNIRCYSKPLKMGKSLLLLMMITEKTKETLLAAAEKITPEMINFMATHGRGLFVLP